MKKPFLVRVLNLDLVSNAFSVLKNGLRSDGDDKIVETFEESLSRLGIPKEGRELFLLEKYNQFRFAFMLNFGAVVFLVLMLLVSIISSGFGIFALLVFAILMPVLLKAFVYSFRSWQIYNKKLSGVKVFIGEKNYFPKSVTVEHFKENVG